MKWNTIRTGGLIAALFCQLCISASAQAQSEEYRRGYEQGYRDGQAGQRPEGWRQPGWQPKPIQILSASYGTRYAACDASESLRRIAGWNRRVDLMVNNNLCGDPAYGRPKRLAYEYQCSDGAVLRGEARENEVITLYCR